MIAHLNGLTPNIDSDARLAKLCKARRDAVVFP